MIKIKYWEEPAFDVSKVNRLQSWSLWLSATSTKIKELARKLWTISKVKIRLVRVTAEEIGKFTAHLC